MFQDDALYSILMFCAAAWLFKMWLADLSNFRKSGELVKGAFECATPASGNLVIIGVIGALLLLSLHTSSEYAAGVAGEQTKVSAWALFSWCSAAFIEELIFRGYLVVKNRSVLALASSIFLFSFLFAGMHPFLWDYTVPEGGSLFAGKWSFDFSLQALLATLAVFECSLFFYILRFLPSNKYRSIIPCIAAHLTYNLGVFVIKLFSGFVEW